MSEASEVSARPSAADLSVLAGVIRDVSRLHRLTESDAQDFAQSVHLRLIERRYDVFARFDGRSSMRSYLTVVVTRLLLDWRNAMYGKWRPCAVARRLGPAAIELDRLINRDGYSADEAAELVQRASPDGVRMQDLADIACPAARAGDSWTMAFSSPRRSRCSWIRSRHTKPTSRRCVPPPRSPAPAVSSRPTSGE
jgi:hypothetical protein